MQDLPHNEILKSPRSHDMHEVTADEADRLQVQHVKLIGEGCLAEVDRDYFGDEILVAGEPILNVIAVIEALGITCEFEYGSTQGESTFRNLRIEGPDDGITATQIRKIPFKRIREETVRLVADLKRRGIDLGSVARARPKNLHPGRPPGRKNSRHYQRLRAAKAYHAQNGDRGATGKVAEELRISVGTARNYIAQARQLGFLEPTTRGKKAHRLTPYGQALVDVGLCELDGYDNNAWDAAHQQFVTSRDKNLDHKGEGNGDGY